MPKAAKKNSAKKAYSIWRSSRPAALSLARSLDLAASDPRMAASVAILYAELARAQTDGDDQAVAYAKRAIAQAFQPIPSGTIDQPLFRGRPSVGSGSTKRRSRRPSL